MAFVTLHADAIKKWKGRHHEFADVLKKYGRTRLPGFANPEWVKVVDDLPVRISPFKIVLFHNYLSASRKHLLERF